MCLLQEKRTLEVRVPIPRRARQGGTEFKPREAARVLVARTTVTRALLGAPALTLPDPTKPFQLFVDERKGVAKGVLLQTLGPWRKPVAYLSEKLDPVAAGWPPCLRIIAATATLVHDADKLTFGQQLAVSTPMQ